MNVCICIFLELLAATNVSGIVVTLVTIKYSIEARLIRSLYNPVYLSRAYKFVTCECKGCLPHSPPFYSRWRFIYRIMQISHWFEPPGKNLISVWPGSLRWKVHLPNGLKFSISCTSASISQSTTPWRSSSILSTVRCHKFSFPSRAATPNMSISYLITISAKKNLQNGTANFTSISSISFSISRIISGLI